MIERLGVPLLALAFMTACDPAVSEEQRLREKYVNQDCFISGNSSQPDVSKTWHSNQECPNLAEELKWPGGPYSKKAPVLPIRTNPDGLLDAKQFKYQIQHCPKCAY